MNRPHHIFFDLDHTLWDYDRNAEETIRELLVSYRQHFAAEVSFDTFYPVYLDHNRRLWESYRNNKIDNLTLRTQRWKDTFHDLGQPYGDWIHQFGEDFLDLCPRKQQLLPNAIEVLEAFQPHFPLHIITNGFAAIQDLKLSYSGLRRFFDVIVTPDQNGFKKPHPNIFQEALLATNCLPENALLIGDSYPEDIQGGNAAGMQVIYYNPKGRENPEGFKEVRDLLELLELVPLTV
jgi:putative hydrolase of the HAD superfamily